MKTGKETIRTSRCNIHNIQQISCFTYSNFSLNELGRLRSGIFFLDKETLYQLRLLTLRKRATTVHCCCSPLWLVEIESTHFVWKTNSLPLTYSHFSNTRFRYLIIPNPHVYIMLHCNRNIFFLKPMWENLRKKVNLRINL